MNNFIVLTILSLAIFVFITTTSAGGFGFKNGFRFTNCTNENCTAETESVKEMVRNVSDKCFLDCQIVGKYLYEITPEEKITVLDCFQKSNCSRQVFNDMVSSTQFSNFMNCANKHCSHEE